MDFRRYMKEALIELGCYRWGRRAYHQLLPTKVGRDHRRQVEFYSEFLSPGDLCFDVGANIGAKSEIFLDTGARVVAFEPQPGCLREMRARCGSNRRLAVVAAAIGRRAGEATLFVGAQTSTSSLRPDWDPDSRGELKVPVVTLDGMIEKYGLPRFCKIDVEGFELEVLGGLSQPIPVISLEYHLDNCDIEKTMSCLDRIAAWGPLLLNLTYGEEPGLSWPEWVSLEQFRSDFPDRAPRSSTCGYGDIFIRSNAG